MNIVYNEDCLPAMQKYPKKFFDLAVVDPPYFSGPERRRYYGSNVSTTKIARHYYPELKHWERPSFDYFDVVFPPGRIVWDKCNGDTTFSDCEIAATNAHDSVRLFRYMWNGMLQGKSIYEGEIARGNKSENEYRIHPTQKPIDLYRWIFQKYAQPGFKILDTHVGSVTSRRAAWEAGLDFIGYEIDANMFRLQEEAFEDHTKQLRIEF